MRDKIIKIGQKTEDYLDIFEETFLIDLMITFPCDVTPFNLRVRLY